MQANSAQPGQSLYNFRRRKESSQATYSDTTPYLGTSSVRLYRRVPGKQTTVKFSARHPSEDRDPATRPRYEYRKCYSPFQPPITFDLPEEPGSIHEFSRADNGFRIMLEVFEIQSPLEGRAPILLHLRHISKAIELVRVKFFAHDGAYVSKAVTTCGSAITYVDSGQ